MSVARKFSSGEGPDDQKKGRIVHERARPIVTLESLNAGPYQVYRVYRPPQQDEREDVLRHPQDDDEQVYQ